MNPNWYLDVLKNRYATFEGRARRQEYWNFALISFGISIVLGVVGALIGLPIISSLYSLAVLVPTIAAGVRRLHDTGRSGWWLLVPILNLVYLIEDSQQGSNQFGANPKASLA